MTTETPDTPGSRLRKARERLGLQQIELGRKLGVSGSYISRIERDVVKIQPMVLRLAEALGVPESEMIHIRRGALLHDIGKMAIPDSILLKEGLLGEEEWRVMRRHPTYAFELLSTIDFLRPALAIPYYHHERWDGSGYPGGIAGEDIPLFARIFAVVDVWDALRTGRPYRHGWTEEQVYQYLADNAGKHFDPRIVETFLRLAYPQRRPPAPGAGG